MGSICMPVYEFRCPDGHETEEQHSFDSVPKQTKCFCGKEARRCIVFPGIHFRGEGWTCSGEHYNTDSENCKNPNPVTTDPFEYHEWRMAKEVEQKNRGKRVDTLAKGFKSGATW